MKRIAALLLVGLLICPFAGAEINFSAFKASGGYITSDDANSVLMEPLFAIPAIYSNVSLCVSFGITDNKSGNSIYLPMLTTMLYFYPEDFEAIKAIHIVASDAEGKEIEYGVAFLGEPIYQSFTANSPSGSITIFESYGHVIMVGSALKSILESMPSNQETYFVFQTQSDKLLYFQITDEIENAFFAFWEDCEKAGGFADEELDVVDFFCPLNRIT